jgi:hypothetical protein
MSSIEQPKKQSKAELRYREAFDRLKSGKPVNLPKGSPVSQNNVAKEAGRVSSALRLSRFPLLVDEIQTWVEAHPIDDIAHTLREETHLRRSKRRSLHATLSDVKSERDDALSKLLDAQRYILQLRDFIARMNGELPKDSGQIVEFRRRKSRRH